MSKDQEVTVRWEITSEPVIFDGSRLFRSTLRDRKLNTVNRWNHITRAGAVQQAQRHAKEVEQREAHLALPTFAEEYVP